MTHYRAILLVLLVMAVDVLFLQWASPPDLMVMPDQGRTPLFRVLADAQKSVWVVAYRLTDEATIQQLRKLCRRGLQVRVLLQRSAENESAEQILRSSGAATQWGDPRYPLTHQKTILIDRRVAWVCTFNLSTDTFRNGRGFAVPVTDLEAVREIERMFDGDWNRQPVQGQRQDLLWVPGNARQQLQAMLGRATARVDVYNEHMDDRSLEDSLIAARVRGVRVRVLMSPDERNEPGRERLLRGGVEVRLLKRPFIHAKVFLLDDLAVVGSINLSDGSLSRNRELAAVVRSPQIAAVFESDWNR